MRLEGRIRDYPLRIAERAIIEKIDGRLPIAVIKNIGRDDLTARELGDYLGHDPLGTGGLPRGLDSPNTQ
jgi:hypothetical protein